MTKLVYLTTFVCQFGRYNTKDYHLEQHLKGNMFQHKIDEISKDLPNVFDIVDDSLAVGYVSDSKDHHKTL